MKKVLSFRSALIFGGAGFVGSNWAHYLLKHTDARVHIYDNLSRRGVHRNLEWLRRECNDSDRLKITIGDVRDAALVQRAAANASEIYHFAAQVAVTTSVADPRQDFEINAFGTLNVLEAARKSGRQPFVLFTSTNKVYGNLSGKELVMSGNRYSAVDGRGVNESQPLDLYSPYGCSKGTADQYVHDYSRMFALPTVVFRMSCIAGPQQFGNEDQGWVAHFLYSALQDRPLTIFGDGRQVRDVLSVKDLVVAFEKVRSQTEKTAGQIYNVGGGNRNAVSLLEVMEMIEEITGKRPRYSLQRPRPGDQLFYVTDFDKLTDHTGWKPKISVRQNIEMIWEWWKQQQRDVISEPLMVNAGAPPSLAEVPEVAS
ncbi:MAG TPA: GDP-mannose 4,6-dehydratase [Terriglobales bacterium]|nr:GDP-mannose 4,6-dehydratase [Terriglobales bacterium]